MSNETKEEVTEEVTREKTLIETIIDKNRATTYEDLFKLTCGKKEIKVAIEDFKAFKKHYELPIIKANLFVPKGCYLKYKEAEYWKNFTFISEINVETGDIDGDGEINVGDVTAHINKLLNAASYDDAVCDINGDGEVNVTDVTSLINMILE